MTNVPSSRSRMDAATRVALVTALLVAAFLLLRMLVGGAARLLYDLIYNQYSTSTDRFGYGTLEVFTQLLPIALGVFVGLRFVVPITAQQRLSSVLVRSIVIAAIGTLFAVVLGLIFSFFVQFTGSFFGNSFPFDAVRNALSGAASAVVNAITRFIDLVPLVALACVLLWLWLRRQAAGAADAEGDTPYLAP